MAGRRGSVRLLLLLAAIIWNGMLSADDPKPDIRIEGVEGERLVNIEAQLSLLDESCDSPRWRVEDSFSLAKREIDKALRALGYYQPVIRTDFSFTPDCWQAEIFVDPGPRIELAEVDLKISGEASDDPAFQAILQNPPLKTGDALHHGRYENLKSRLINLAEQRGYFDGHFSVHELKVDPSRGLAWVRLHYDSGRRYRLGEIEIQQDILKPDFVRRYLPVKPGEPYSGAKMAETYQALADSEYFADVEIRPAREEIREGEIPVTIRLFSRKQHYFKIGVGFDTNTGPRLSLGYENRRVNRRGHRLEINGRASPVRSELSGRYLIPWTDPMQETLNLQGGYLHEETDTLRTDSAVFGAHFVHPRQRWTEQFGLNLKYESSNIEGDENQSSLLIVPAIHWNRIKADDRLRPKRGWKIDFSFEGGSSLLGDPVHYLQAHTYSKGVYQLPWRGRILSRIEAGATWTDRFANLPASSRFFAGGDTSVRGYGYKRLGPENNDGDVIGGRYLGVASLEYEQLFLQNWGAALFADVGNAFTTFDEPVKIGAGLGVRWYSPVGPIRVDLATPVNDSGFKLRVHVSMGPEL